MVYRQRAFRPLHRALVLATVAVAGLLALSNGLRVFGEEPPERVAVAIIVNSENVVSGLTMPELRALFNLKTRFWLSGMPVQVILPGKQLQERAVMLEQVYRMSATELAESWRQRIFAGEIHTVPTGAPSSQALVRMVENNRAAIAAVRASAVTDKVHVVRIEGKLPGEPDYPLQ